MQEPGSVVVVNELIRHGVDTVFGVMGVGNLNVVTDFERRDGTRYIATRHEAAAVNMADGFARTSGRLGVATVTQGPGFTNVITALTSAARHRVPMLLITGSVSRHSNQFIDQEALVAPTGALYVDLGPDGWAEGTARAIALARRARKPVVLVLPSDAQEKAMDATPVELADEPVVLPVVDADQVREAARLLSVAQRPVILAGRGAVAAGALDGLIRLADRVSGLLATSLQGKSAFDGHPFNLGIAGGFASLLAHEELSQADCVIAFGASLNPWTTERGMMFPKATFVQCDVDAAAIGSYTPVTVSLVGDADAVVGALLAELGDAEVASTAREGDLAERIAAFGPSSDFVETHNDFGLDPRSVSVALDESMPMPRTVVIDGGHFVGFPAMYMQIAEPADLLFTMGFSSIGMGLGTAIGAALGRPDQPVVALVGDGGVMQSIADLDTAARYGIALTVVVFDDGAYGAEIHHLRHHKLSEVTARFVNPSFVELANALGVPAAKASSLDEVRALAGSAAAAAGPYVIEVPINGDVLSRWFANTMGEMGTP